MMAENQERTDVTTIDLKDPVLAGVLAWLIPGWGHWYQGRRAKAVLYFVCIMGLFAWGVYLGGSSEKCLESNGTIGYGRAVYFSWRENDRRLHYIFQAGVGISAMPAVIQAARMNKNLKVWWGGFMAPPRLETVGVSDPNIDQPTAHELHYQLHHYLDLAGFFTMVAGLLNILAIYDACAGPVAGPPPASEEKTAA